MAIGKTAPNGTLNADGAFYSVQDVNVLLENAGGDLPTPTIADAGKAVVVDEEGKYALDTVGGGGGSLLVEIADGAMNASYNDLSNAMSTGKNLVIHKHTDDGEQYYMLFLLSVYEGEYMAVVGTWGSDAMVSTIYSAMSADANLETGH